jgi:nucleoside phosphorylase
VANDRLFKSTYNHIPEIECWYCDPNEEIQREVRISTEPEIHYGTIASYKQAIKSATTRDRILEHIGEDCIGIVNEPVGLLNLPRFVIRGICDYGDSHANDRWQEYAAATAAAYAKEFLGNIGSEELWNTPKIIDMRHSFLI